MTEDEAARLRIDNELLRMEVRALSRPIDASLREAERDADIMQGLADKALTLLIEWRDSYCRVKPAPDDWYARFEEIVGPVTPEMDPSGVWPTR